MATPNKSRSSRTITTVVTTTILLFFLACDFQSRVDTPWPAKGTVTKPTLPVEPRADDGDYQKQGTNQVDNLRPNNNQTQGDFTFYPPHWIQDYIQFHKSQVRSDGYLIEPTTRYLQYQCLHAVGGREGRCGGLGDRLKGIIMGLLFSMIDQRVYLVNWDDFTPLSDYLAPAHVDWLAKPQPETENDELDTLWLPSDKYHPFLENPCEWTSNATGISYRCGVLKSQKKMNATCIQSFFPKDETPDPLMWHGMFWTLFRFTERTTVAAQQMLGSLINPKYYIGVHIRTGGNGTTFTDPNRHGSLDDWQAFSDCTALMQVELSRHCGSTMPSVYVASDSNDAKAHLQQHVSHVHATPVEIYHIDRSDQTLVQNLTMAYDAVWAEFKILMDATCLVVGRSGFSLLAMHMAPLQPHCAVSFDKCTVDIVRQAVEQNARC